MSTNADIITERVEAEARERYPADDVTVAGIHMGDLMENLQAAFIAGRTVTAEQVEAAAKALDKNFNPDQWPVMAAMFRDYAATALAAAGLLIEGDSNAADT